MDTTDARSRLEEERERLEALRDEDEETSGLDEEQSESSGDLADYDQHPGDVGTETFERTKDLAVQDQLEARLSDVDAALERIEEGSYGRCAACGKEIEPERLEARPATRYCLEHQEEADAQANRVREEEGPF